MFAKLGGKNDAFRSVLPELLSGKKEQASALLLPGPVFTFAYRALTGWANGR